MGATRTTAPGVPAGGRRCRRAPSTWAWALLAFPGAAGAATFGESSTRACTEMEAGGVLTPAAGELLVIGSGKSRDLAWGKAQQQAVHAYGGGSATREAMIVRSLVPWCVNSHAVGTFGAAREVTVVGSIERAVVDSLAREQARLDEQLDALAGVIAALPGIETLVLSPTAWSSGCVADVSRFVNARVRNRVFDRTGVTLASSPPVGADYARLRFELVTLGEQGSITVALSEAGQNRTLGHVDFALDVFGLESGDLGQCATNDTLGLPAGGLLVGRDGLAVRMESSVTDGVACEGERAWPWVYTNESAVVHVFSVDPAGAGYHVWPVGPPVATKGRLELGSADLVPLKDGGDERLIAVAIPAREAATTKSPWQGFCRLATPFDAKSLPAGAAASAASFVVYRAGTYGCAEREAPSAEATLAAAPTCN